VAVGVAVDPGGTVRVGVGVAVRVPTTLPVRVGVALAAPCGRVGVAVLT